MTPVSRVLNRRGTRVAALALALAVFLILVFNVLI